MARLTIRLITATPCPPTGETWLPDDSLPGFGVRFRAGLKTYSVRYRTTTGQARRANLGTINLLNLEQARAMAHDLLVAVRQGRDPVMERQETRQGMTISDLAAKYLAEHTDVHKKLESRRIDRNYLRLHILPALGTRLVTAVNRADVAKLHHELRATPPAANRCLALLSHMLTMAERWELRPQGTNPAYGVQRYREFKKERFLSSDELARVHAVLAQAEAQCTESIAAVAALRLLLYTGARVGEILGLKWEFLDITNGVARLPDSKTGAKLLWLPAPALDVLRGLPRDEAAPWVLPGKLPTRHLASVQKPWRRLCAQAGIDGVRVHDIRHSYASWAAMAGLSMPMLGKLLGHSNAATTMRYLSFAHDPVRAASEQVGEVLAGMGGKATPK